MEFQTVYYTHSCAEMQMYIALCSPSFQVFGTWLYSNSNEPECNEAINRIYCSYCGHIEIGLLTPGETMSADAECRARYSLCQQRQSSTKSLSCITGLGDSSPPPDALLLLKAALFNRSRLEVFCGKRKYHHSLEEISSRLDAV